MHACNSIYDGGQCAFTDTIQTLQTLIDPCAYPVPTHVVLVRQSGMWLQLTYRIIEFPQTSENGHLLNLLATPVTLFQGWHAAPTNIHLALRAPGIQEPIIAYLL